MTNVPETIGAALARDEARPLRQKIRKQLIVKPGRPADLAARDTGWTGGPPFDALSEKVLKAAAKEYLEHGRKALAEAQALLWASDTYALLVVFQAMDAAGKDSTIKHVMSGINPQGVLVRSFKRPSEEELDHDFLWRINKALPERGQIGIFNRSHYEEVGVVRVHPEFLDRQKLPAASFTGSVWKKRYEDINEFEHHLDRSGTKIIKFFLHVSKDEQKRRFLKRLEEPQKHWKFKLADVEERKHWDEYMQAYEDAITATSTRWAPWFVIPADHKAVMQAMVVGILLDTVRTLDLQWPAVPEDELVEAKGMLEAEK